MITNNLKSLVGRLNATCRYAMEESAKVCRSQSHYEVDVEHLLSQILQGDNTDVHAVLRHYQIAEGQIRDDLERALAEFQRGNTRTPVLARRLPGLFESALLLASVDYGQPRIRSGHLLVAMLVDHDTRNHLLDSAPSLGHINVEDLKLNLPTLTAETEEAETAAGAEQALSGGASQRDLLRPSGKTPFLDQYTINLTERARQGKIDPVLGRDGEIRQLVDILTRRRQNNPILTGEAGVGKTAVVEGFALRIAQRDVPPPLQSVALHTLDLGLLQAGASVKGEFEARLKGVIDEVKRSPHPIIVFIDEAHTLIGAGGAAGQGDAANLLKPALARGEMRTIAATTWSEYKKYFEKDAALARRFQVVKVDEPTEQQAVRMLRGITAMMERHHNVRILDEAVTEAVRLSHRYLTGRQLPDKGVSVLDTACARVAIGQTAIPAQIEDARRHVQNLETEIATLEREMATGGDHQSVITERQREKESMLAQLGALEQRWDRERDLVNRIGGLRTQLESALDRPRDIGPASAETLTDSDRERLKSELKVLTDQLAEQQGEAPLIQVCVDAQSVSEVISTWTGIPAGKMLKDEINTVRNLRSLLEERVIGQSHALDQIAQRIRTARANLEDPNKPIAVFMLVGTSGVGKTETALALADILYGGERNMITINMSEYQESHTVSGLKGSPPGYVGYGEGGVLTEAVRRKPYSVVLLDEVEKAHPDVLELFFQVFDKGVMDDAEGREIDFKNTVIILTSNVGTDTIMRLCMGKEAPPEPESLVETLRPELQRVFKPAFLGRLKVVPYYPIRDEIMRRIIELKLAKIRRRVAENHRAQLIYDDTLVGAVAHRCTEVDSGARNVDHILNGSLLPQIAEEVLARMAEGHDINSIAISVSADGQFQCALN